jgi:DNA-binding MarR family transcriptional regulator
MPSKYVNMADITRDIPRGRRINPMQSSRNAQEIDAEKQELISHVELLFFAYRDFTGDPDAVLAQYGFGRAHHRVLHFVNRNPGLRVANLLEILKITKQSLARVLKQLIGEGFITQKAGAEDRRERLLFVTAKGARLAERLTLLQVARVEAAIKAAGRDAESATRRFLLAMISEEDRAQVEALVRAQGMLPADAPQEDANDADPNSAGDEDRASKEV